ncbi:MAG: hypothetical protein ABI758_00250 [Candidatus Woesebacteria bacterium]
MNEKLILDIIYGKNGPSKDQTTHSLTSVWLRMCEQLGIDPNVQGFRELKEPIEDAKMMQLINPEKSLPTKGKKRK